MTLRSLATTVAALASLEVALSARVSTHISSREVAEADEAAEAEAEGASEVEIEEETVETVKKSEERESQVSYHFNFASDSNSSGRHGNLVGYLDVQFPSGGEITSHGFFQEPQTYEWPMGAILGKSDDAVWPIESQSGGGGGGGAYSFGFDHLASDLVFGDMAKGQTLFRPEFEEMAFTRGSALSSYNYGYGGGVGGVQVLNATGGYGRGGKHGKQGKHYGANASHGIVKKLLDEEKRENKLRFHDVHEAGFLTATTYNNGGHKSKSYKHTYFPQLRLSRTDGGLDQLSSQSDWYEANMARPFILDIDNLFRVAPKVPETIRTAVDVYLDTRYNKPPLNTAFVGDLSGQCRPTNSYNGTFSMLRQYAGKKCEGQCTTKYQCETQLNGRWKQSSRYGHYCTGTPDCGCCKDIGRGASKYVEGVNSEQQTLPVQFQVRWLIPVLQKFRCVPVSYTAQGYARPPVFIAMGWDTESFEAQYKAKKQKVADLDLDLSLVPIDKWKRVIKGKRVWFSSKAPGALSCGGGYGSGARMAMRGFTDDRSGEGAGDDELVKIDLECLENHRDIDAVIVTVNIYEPSHVRFSDLDSAYLRIVTGGQEAYVRKPGNDEQFVVNNADGVRSYMRLSGDDLKRDGELNMNGLAVGMFFRNWEAGGSWAFASIMQGIRGRTVDQSTRDIERMMMNLVYPASSHWDTSDNKQAASNGAFGEAGMLAKGRMDSLVSGGDLPCITTKGEKAMLKLGRMNSVGLQNIINREDELRRKIPQGQDAWEAEQALNKVIKTAKVMKQSEKQADKIRKMAAAVDNMEKVNTKAERQEAVKEAMKEKPVITEKDSAEAEEDIFSLFEDP
eukprot:TRINITY_DN3705_c0_g2_i1.p1 TRINITY_DN3705_c0_g2~~TRINITY_DN3705_c0_g2_i1.p1  ORF type:complete len:845 (-),score=198.18 TRINITY_DN3705_c0_g2_i1:71-2605(-)